MYTEQMFKNTKPPNH